MTARSKLILGSFYIVSESQKFYAKSSTVLPGWYAVYFWGSSLKGPSDKDKL